MSGFDDDGNGNLRMYDYYSGNVKKYINSAVGTIDFIDNFNNLFDILNSSSLKPKGI